ncbi:unnamed protein product [Lepeophtheirus salmonis]|uniref:(salmon louse) hypothetical protein n=1 Tax=Lepeophtheirus salmonis TaxID=72036 RepID=A0A7R8GZC6_LEPSM|nr:unnamed protein product [Lepeophtheirus salmonis]CAF2761879.1 unnamed protein product [Lepeophtheirus salmonis]
MSNFYYHKLSSDTFLKVSSLEENNTLQFIVYSNGKYYMGTTQVDSSKDWSSSLFDKVTFDNYVLTVNDVAIELSLVEGLSEQNDFMSGIVRKIVSLKKEVSENQDKLSKLNSQLNKDKLSLNSMKDDKLMKEKEFYENCFAHYSI